MQDRQTRALKPRGCCDAPTTRAAAPSFAPRAAPPLSPAHRRQSRREDWRFRTVQTRPSASTSIPRSPKTSMLRQRDIRRGAGLRGEAMVLNHRIDNALGAMADNLPPPQRAGRWARSRPRPARHSLRHAQNHHPPADESPTNGDNTVGGE